MEKKFFTHQNEFASSRIKLKFNITVEKVLLAELFVLVKAKRFPHHQPLCQSDDGYFPLAGISFVNFPMGPIR
jgi:hypothetical protein